jgi:hypothetical protein
MTGVATTPSFWLVEMGVSLIVCLGWPGMEIILISYSRVPGIKGMSNCTQLNFFTNRKAKT